MVKKEQQLRDTLIDLLAFVCGEFDWASDGEQNDACRDGNLCSECQANGCLADKIRRASEALSS
jgi:hypothetical protein